MVLGNDQEKILLVDVMRDRGGGTQCGRTELCSRSELCHPGPAEGHCRGRFQWRRQVGPDCRQQRVEHAQFLSRKWKWELHISGHNRPGWAESNCPRNG